MSFEQDFYGEILRIVEEETAYLAHYIGEVVDVNDELKKGRVKIMLSELGLDKPALGIWCNPRAGNAMTLPKVGQFAEVYFINGDRSRPVYLFPVTEVKDNTPKNWTGTTTNHIIFEDPNDKTKNVQIIDGKMIFFDGTEALVLGDKLETFLTSVKNWLDAHTHTTTAVTGGGGPVGVISAPITPSPSIPGDLLSEDVKTK